MADSGDRPHLSVVIAPQAWNGSGRIVVLLRLFREEYGGTLPERVLGPWRPGEEARAELRKIGEALGSGSPITLEWLVVERDSVIAAYFETEVSRITGR